MHNRRALHLPLLSLPCSPPPPAEPPYSFFPSYPAPPPPSPAPLQLQPTVPANISFAHPEPHAREAFSKVVAVILLPLLALALIAAATFVFLVHRRRRRRYFSDPHPSFRAAYNKSPSTSAVPAAASNNASVNARASVAPVEDGSAPSEDTLDGCGELDSPGLRPLPPLPRHFQHGDGEAEETGASEEEFFSPWASLIEKESSRRASISWRTISAAAAEECGSQSSSRSTPPYPSSNLDSSPRSSPVTSGPRVRSSSGHYSSKSERGFAGSLDFLAPTPAAPPPPPPPLTPSPPKRRPATLFQPSSLIATNSNRKVEFCDIARENLRSRHITYACPRQLLGISTLPAPPQQNQDPPPPPPPPPPPSIGHWQSQSRKLQARQPPLDVPSYLASAVSIDPTANSKAAEKNAEISRPKLKPLHWDKVQASSNRAMVWDQLKSSSFHVNEEMIETLFVSNATSTPPKETNIPQALPLPTQENWVLHPKKAQNISILLRALNVTKQEVCEALLEGCTDSLGTELLETLLKMSPTKEEEQKLKEHKNDSAFKLGPAENFLKALLDIPFVFKRLDAMLYIANFDSEIDFLMKSFETLKAACEELRSSRLFSKLLDAVLKTGNRMNVGTFRGDAQAFKLETLLKLVDIKGNDGKTTVLHFVVQEITRAEGSRRSAEAPLLQEITPQDDLECRKLGLQIIAGLEGELSNVKKAAAFDSDVLSGYVSHLVGGMEKINEVLKLNEELGSENKNRKFHDAMTRFLKSAEDDIVGVQTQESVASSLVKEITEYFHGNSAREETHPLRIFMVVRDFLLILAQVCKDVGRLNEQANISLGRKLPAPTNPIVVPIFPRFMR